MYKYEKTTPKTKKHFNIFARFMSTCFLLMLSPVIISYAISVMSKNINQIDTNTLSDFILPVVMQDPPCFNKQNPLPENIMLSAAVWDAAMQKKANNNLLNKDQKLVIQKRDIEQSYKKLFGNKNKLPNLTSLSSDFFEFDKNKNQFLVKSISGCDNYSPNILNVYTHDNEFILKVGYIMPSNQFDKFMHMLPEPKIEKVRTYKLKYDKLSKNNLYIYEISN